MELAMSIFHAVSVEEQGKNIILHRVLAPKNAIIVTEQEKWDVANVEGMAISYASIAMDTVHHNVQYVMVMVW